MRLAALIVVCMVALGAANCGSVVAQSRRLAPPGSETAELVVFRKSQIAGSAVTVPVEIDGKTVANIGSGDYVAFDVATGQRFLAVGFSGRVQLVRLQVEAGKSYYFQFHFDMMNRASDDIDILERLSDEQGRREIASGDYDALTPSR